MSGFIYYTYYFYNGGKNYTVSIGSIIIEITRYLVCNLV